MYIPSCVNKYAYLVNDSGINEENSLPSQRRMQENWNQEKMFSFPSYTVINANRHLTVHGCLLYT